PPARRAAPARVTEHPEGPRLGAALRRPRTARRPLVLWEPAPTPTRLTSAPPHRARRSPHARRRRSVPAVPRRPRPRRDTRHLARRRRRGPRLLHQPDRVPHRDRVRVGGCRVAPAPAAAA